MNFVQKMILDAAIENIKDDMELIGEWCLKHYSDVNNERDYLVISAIKRIDNAIEKLLLLEIDSTIIEKHFVKFLQFKSKVKL